MFVPIELAFESPTNHADADLSFAALGRPKPGGGAGYHRQHRGADSTMPKELTPRFRHHSSAPRAQRPTGPGDRPIRWGRRCDWKDPSCGVDQLVRLRLVEYQSLIVREGACPPHRTAPSLESTRRGARTLWWRIARVSGRH